MTFNPELPWTDGRGDNPAANVARGAAWLDSQLPGWERKIDLSILDISDGNVCICGQVVPQEVIDKAGAINGYDAVYEATCQGGAMTMHGFAGGYHGDHWVNLIKERFDSGILSDMVSP